MAVRWCRIGAISLGVAGLALSFMAWYRGEPRRRVKVVGVLSLLALTWDYVLLGIALGFALLVLTRFSA